MTPERLDRRGLALGVAVFLSGTVLLGLEIVASRVLAPAFGSSLYVWGALIGVVLTGLAIGYWAGGTLADRWPTPYLFISVLALGSVLVLAVPVLDDRIVERVVSWDAGPRLDPLLAATILFGPASVVLASATPVAVRLAARSIDRLGNDRRAPVRNLHRRQHRRHIRHGVLAGARARNRPGDRVRRRRAARGRSRRRLRRAAARTRGGAGRRGGRGRARRRVARSRDGRPRRGLGRAQLLAAVPDPGGAHPAPTRPCCGGRPRDGVRRARSPRHPVSPAARGRRRGQPLPAVRQLVPERHVSEEPVPDTVRVHGLPPPRSRLHARGEARPLHRSRRWVGAEAHVARLPRPTAAGCRARSGCRHCRIPLVCASA